MLTVGQQQDIAVTFTPFDGNNYNEVGMTAKINVYKATPVITWSNPADIVYGTPLSSTQLNATAATSNPVPGTWTYEPALGTILTASQGVVLKTTFTPRDLVDYEIVTKFVNINVAKATPIVSWSNPAFIIQGTPLSATQLNASANVPGTFVYTPALGTVLNFGVDQTLSVTFTPSDAIDYVSVTTTVKIDVMKAAPITQAQITNFENVYGTNFKVNWTRGNGDFCAVFVKQGKTGSPAPMAGTYYTPSADFQMGSQVGDWYCVYVGTGTSVKVSNLMDSTDYRVMVIEYNDYANYPNYQTATNANDPLNIRTMIPVNDNNLVASNYISPNGDGVNDAWVVNRVDELVDFDLYIFNNIGEIVYQTKGYKNDWKGTVNGADLPSGTYYYIFKKGNYSIKGFITIVR
jgi:gliding motility-associated-like protein